MLLELFLCAAVYCKYIPKRWCGGGGAAAGR